MIIDPPKSPQEALHQASLEVGNLRKKMRAAKVGEILSSLDTVGEYWLKQDLEQFPFNILIKEIDTIKAELHEVYADELDLSVGKESFVFDQVVSLDHKIRIYSELVVLNPVYRTIERCLQNINDILPSRNFGFKDLLDDLRLSFDPKVRGRLETALAQYRREEYELALAECGKAEGILFSHFRVFLEKQGINLAASNVGSAIGEIRKALPSKRDENRLSLSKSSRIELLVLSMFETLHYFRNLCAHDRTEEVSEEQLPQWQVRRREWLSRNLNMQGLLWH